LRLPTVGQVVAINHAVREADEWFDEPDEIDRIGRLLAAFRDRSSSRAESRAAKSRVVKERGQGTRRDA